MLPVKEDSHVDIEDVSRLQRSGVRDPVRRDVIHLKYIFGWKILQQTRTWCGDALWIPVEVERGRVDLVSDTNNDDSDDIDDDVNDNEDYDTPDG